MTCFCLFGVQVIGKGRSLHRLLTDLAGSLRHLRACRSVQVLVGELQWLKQGKFRQRMSGARVCILHQLYVIPVVSCRINES